jgi:RHS repeat-associated protein
VNGQVTEYYLWYNQTKLAAVLNADKSVRMTYIYTPESDGPSMILKDGTTYKILNDPGLASVRYVLNMDQKQIAQEVEYDEYGNILNSSNTTFQPVLYAGGLYDFDTKLYRFGARDYDPTIGRWTAKDPIGFAGGDTNLYAYVNGNPMSYNDPSGNCPWCAGAAVGFISGAIGGYTTGGFWGGVAGSVAGAGVGFINPWGSSTAGAFAGGVASSLISQVLGNGISEQPLSKIDPILAVASGFGGSTAALGAKAATAIGVSNIAVDSGIATFSDLLFTIPAQNMSPGPINFGRVCAKGK